MGKKLFECHLPKPRVHPFRQFGEDGGDIRIPVKFSPLHQSGSQQGGHGFGIRTQMEPVVYCHRNIRPGPARPDRPGGQDFSPS